MRCSSSSDRARGVNAALRAAPERRIARRATQVDLGTPTWAEIGPGRFYGHSESVATIRGSCSRSATACARRGCGRAWTSASVEADTKIRGKYLQALEDERFEVLPGETYVKGFLRTYAEYLGLDGQLYVDEFNSRFASVEEPPTPSTPPRGATATACRSRTSSSSRSPGSWRSRSSSSSPSGSEATTRPPTRPSPAGDRTTSETTGSRPPRPRPPRRGRPKQERRSSSSSPGRRLLGVRARRRAAASSSSGHAGAGAATALHAQAPLAPVRPARGAERDAERAVADFPADREPSSRHGERRPAASPDAGR